MSPEAVAFSPMACSGGRYWAVPITIPAAVKASARGAREIPKSVSFATPLSDTKIFAGFTSR